MSNRSAVILAAVICLTAAWGLMFAGWILGLPSARSVPLWGVLSLLFVSGLLMVFSRRSTRTRWGILLVIILSAAGVGSVRLSSRSADDLEASWRREESQNIASTLYAVGEEIGRLESISAAAGERIATGLRAAGFGDEGAPLRNRIEVFGMLDSVAAAISSGGAIPAGTEIGLQLFDTNGRRIAWAGWPQTISQLDRDFVRIGTELVYSREVSLYRILTHLIPVSDDNGERRVVVLVDLPLEVNYRVNNRFLKSTGIADNISTGDVADIAFEYYAAFPSLPQQLGRYKQIHELNTERRATMLRHRREAGQAAPGDSILSYYPFPPYTEPTTEITGDKNAGLRGRVLVRSPMANPVVSVTARGHPLRHYVDQYHSRWLTWTKSFIVLALLVLFVVAMLALGRHGIHAWMRAAVFVGFLVLLRYSLLSFQTFSIGGERMIFDPTVFATPLLGGILRSSGDLFITGVFYVVVLYGLMKMIRSHGRRRDNGESKHEHPLDVRKPVPWAFAVKGIVIASSLYGVYWLARGFSNVVVVNANPRLIGETMRLTDANVLVLHLGAFLTLTGILLTGMLIVWGMFRLTGWRDAVRSSWTAFALLVTIALTAGPIELAPIAGLVLVFIVLAPRYVQREDIVSIAIVSFCLVIITSGLTYLFFSRDYDGLRKGFVREKANGLIKPSDNWKVVILEDILDGYTGMPEIRRTLEAPGSRDAQRCAFDLWADGPLSSLGFSCAIHVVNERDSVISDFSIDMPFRVRIHEGGEPIDTPVEDDWVVLDLTRSTPQGIVRFYRGIVNIEDNHQFMVDGALSSLIGKVIVDVPYFFESLQWAARTGPRTPELLRNVQEGGVAPRVEEPEALLLARLDGRQVFESSSENLPAGFIIPDERFDRGLDGRWPLLNTRLGAYRVLIQETDEPGRYLLAGFAIPSPVRHLIRWSTLFSLYLFFTALIIVAIILLSAIPYLKELLPTLTPGRKLGFQQKLLASFLVVALVPAVILGLFSVDFIENRFVEENKQEALDKAFSARKALVNLLHGEMQLFLAQSDATRLFTEAGYAQSAATGSRIVEVFSESGTAGPLQVDEDGALLDVAGSTSAYNVDPSEASSEDLYIVNRDGVRYVGVLSAPMLVSGGGWSLDYYLYFARRIDADLLGDIADQISADVNVFDVDGNLLASSQEGLLAGGLISSIINSDAFVRVCLLGSDRVLATEKAGQYRYQVAYLPMTSWAEYDSAAVASTSVSDSTEGGAAVQAPVVRAAMSVPLVFLPESYSLEIQKATSVILGIFALLFVATIGMGLLLARGIFEPLRGLLEGTRRIIRGDLEVRLPMRRTDEIGTLVSAFNEMTVQLSESRRELDERHRYLETILVNIGTGVISTDADDRIRTVNSAASRILKIEATAVIGRTAAEMVEASLAPEIFSLLRVGREAADKFIASEVELQRDRRRATIKYMLTKLDVEDRYLGTVFVFEDLTELIQTKKLSAWVEMARQIAHEIKNPLTPIRISTQFMQRAYEQRSERFDQIFRESSETIIQQVDVLKRIASEFSSYGRMQHLNVAPRELAPLLENILKPYERNTAGVEVNIANGVPDAVVEIDTEAVRKICTNLIENAMDAMPDGGRLDVSCREEQINGETFVRVSFRDTGRGLSDEAVEKLFEPYFSTKTTGTGLGLAICRSLSQEMGGDIDVHNVPGGGVEASLLLRTSRSTD